jgi:hypothetical protein
MAPKKAQSVAFSSSMVRAGSASPSRRQNFQPMSPSRYSAEKPAASSTVRAAWQTSGPMPSPGSQAMR